MNERTATLLREIDQYTKDCGIAETTFGRLAVNDGKLVRRLRGGGDIGTVTAAKVRQFMGGDYRPAGATGWRFTKVSRGGEKSPGATRHPLYKRWTTIIQRCTNPHNPKWKHYGGRGIRICAEWRQSFARFAAEIERECGPKPDGPGWTLDRINNDKGYQPGNMRWATHTTQRHNRRPGGRDHYTRDFPFP